MIHALVSLVLAFGASFPKDCPLLDRQYKVPPINGPKEISKDPIPKQVKP